MLKTGFSSSYFVGTDGQYAGAIMDDAGNGVDESAWGTEIPQRPLQTLIIDDIERDEFGSVWGRSNGQLVELFFQSENEFNEFEEIRNGYREVVWVERGRPASFEGDCLYCQASEIGDEV
jgi:hypothetical protein